MEFVYTIQGLRKRVPPNREILRGITLAFLPGAKIGVIGHNGAGKSTLLRIMAGLDPEFDGEAKPTEGVRVGFVPQEPELDPDKDVLGNIEVAVSEQRALLRRFDAIHFRPASGESREEAEARVRPALDEARAFVEDARPPEALQ